MERGKFGDLARTDATVYRMLADAPAGVLNDLLDRAYAEKRTALVLALVQALGDRADRAAAASAPNRPSRFERGLDYPDPRVQFAAANALLRSPVPIDGRVRGRVLDVLKRAAAADPGVPGGAKGQALLADPDRRRSQDTAVMLRQIGYDVEVFGTGRDLLRRVARASDFDLVVIDRHVPNPELRDLVCPEHGAQHAVTLSLERHRRLGDGPGMELQEARAATHEPRDDLRQEARADLRKGERDRRKRRQAEHHRQGTSP